MRPDGLASFLVIGLCAALLSGCPPKIGDECETSGDCSAQENRLCDITQPGGYCTVFNCEPGGCSDEGVCVAFNARLSTVPGCQNPNGLSRFARSFCLANCESDDDCRTGYVCADMSDPNNPWGAVLVDDGSARVCAVPMSGAPLPADRSNGVCTGAPATDPGGGEAGAGGADGAGGSEGS